MDVLNLSVSTCMGFGYQCYELYSEVCSNACLPPSYGRTGLFLGLVWFAFVSFFWMVMFLRERRRRRSDEK